jgi:hypothetical protein
MKLLLLFASTALASGLLFANIYTSLVDARSWGSGIPQSIETAREYFKTVNPANFFRIIAPLNLVVGLLALIMFWKVSATVRIYLGVALALYVCVDVLTFAYFYPRNAIMFEKGSLTDVDTLKNALTGWRAMNWVRSLIIFAGLVFSFLALRKIYIAK